MTTPSQSPPTKLCSPNPRLPLVLEIEMLVVVKDRAIKLNSHFRTPFHRLYTKFRRRNCCTAAQAAHSLFLPTEPSAAAGCPWTCTHFSITRVSCLMGHVATLTPGELETPMLLLMQLPTLHAFPGSRRSGQVHFCITREHAILASVAGGGGDGGRCAVTSSFRT
ncbi:predicted protein [Histoplasma capsulatum var. duboisii H88]|uniref:Predicted protein n=1 Tax=Ajellomyces capsulatus (strain H88) TaxID=544711 RepID=F0UK42_AJEC8|nr:predicted protein [Histoplasma capsulatum var. duboisii H88]